MTRKAEILVVNGEDRLMQHNCLAHLVAISFAIINGPVNAQENHTDVESSPSESNPLCDDSRANNVFCWGKSVPVPLSEFARQIPLEQLMELNSLQGLSGEEIVPPRTLLVIQTIDEVEDHFAD